MREIAVYTIAIVTALLAIFLFIAMDDEDHHR